MDVTDFLNEIISGLTIALLMIPESMAFSLTLGLPPSVGLRSTMVISLIMALFSGSPATVSGSSAAVTTALMGITTLLGKEFIFLGVILGGIIQVLLGVTGLYKWIYNISKPVSSGYLIGLGALIGYSQIENFQDEPDHKWFEEEKLFFTLGLSLLSIAITFFGLIIFRVGILEPIDIIFPGELVSIILIMLLFYCIPSKLPIEVIGDKGDVKNTIPTLGIPHAELSIQSFLKLLPFSLAMAIAGLNQGMIMIKETNGLKIDSDPFRATVVQGIANIVSGLCGGIGGCVLIGESKSNLENGSKTNVSSISASLFFILFTLFLYDGIENIPMPAIIGILIVIAYRTADWTKLFEKFDKKWLTTFLTALIGFSTNNLALAMIIGSIVEKII